MNKRDQDNLDFLLYSSELVLQDWYSQANADDLEYAQALMAIKATELRAESVAVRIEAELAVDPSYTLANAVIQKYLINQEQK